MVYEKYLQSQCLLEPTLIPSRWLDEQFFGTFSSFLWVVVVGRSPYPPQPPFLYFYDLHALFQTMSSETVEKRLGLELWFGTIYDSNQWRSQDLPRGGAKFKRVQGSIEAVAFTFESAKF